MPHPLDGCRAKLARSGNVFEQLTATLGAYLGRRPFAPEGAYEPASHDWVVRFRVREEPPIECAVIIGDVVHNLRSALDHLAWQLVLANGAEPTARTQFPIYSTEQSYRAERAQQLLAGMSDEDKTAIESFQPFRQEAAENRPHELAVLQELSNVDKHRVVHATLIQTAGSSFTVYGLDDASGIGPLCPQFGLLEDGAELARIELVPAGDSPRVQVDANLELDFAFADQDSLVYNENVLGVLVELRDYVENVVSAFAPRLGQ
jgi:hypothetical protein